MARRLTDHEPLRDTIHELDETVTWESIAVEARPLLIAAAWHAKNRKVLVVANNYDRALKWQARLKLCGVPEDSIRIMPSGLSVLFEDAAPETVALSDRIGALKFLIGDEPGFVIATPQAALERTLPPDLLADAFIEIKPKDEIDQNELLEKFSRLGYEHHEPVRLPGTYSRRGGIVDIFPMGFERPVRIEFWGDEVESLRVFDPNNQRSIGNLQPPAPSSSGARTSPQDEGVLTIAPSRETMLPADGAEFKEMLERAVLLEGSKLSDEAAKHLEQVIASDAQALEQRVFFDRLDLYRPLIHPESSCAVDLLGKEGLLVLDEPLELAATVERSEEEFGQALDAREHRGEILSATVNDYILPPDHFAYADRTLNLTSMNGLPTWLEAGEKVEIGAESLASYRGQPTGLTQAIQNWLDSGLSVSMATDQPSRAKSVLGQVGIFATDDDDVLAKGLHMLEGNPAGGFVMPSANIAVLSDHELFGVARLKLPQRKFREGVPIATVLDLKVGDFVVHINFGIGVYRGLVKRTQDGIEKEYLFLEYKRPDKLFVPADQLDRIQKYLAPGEKPPKINRLTGGDWKKAIKRAREEAREFAHELIKLYAHRKEVKRPGYGPDTPWQEEMESSFPWAETPSQHEAIQEVKQDLQSENPMDRLICGDVGFGKTEVAIRAAFKVAQQGKQVAVLCPTTILSEQHKRTFMERLAPFPVKIDILNRFRTQAERRKILERLEKGDIDIIIGTHALLSKELKFKNLGLLVIDEEQKFGVKHKESLKKMRMSIDVMSLSATPIPRTLSMAVMHIRQMSVINDPPPGRLPIRTFVRPYGDDVVREAILRELARGGQVFYVYNRVQGIQHVAERIKKLVPTARVAVAHGQMGEREIEPVMMGFLEGEVDVLVSTTIVENGLDISNANTLIVENSDMFGLSQLYQLRGRVGRSDRQAYAYLFYQGAKTMTENATSRLAALQEFSQLGSGYALAFRDLQIRGAGDLLGASQSGQMTAVGFDLYAQLIDSEVSYLKAAADGAPYAELEDPLEGMTPLPGVDIPVLALIPEAYISEEGQRLYFYKRMMTCRDQAELQGVEQEIEDRYGHPPTPVKTAMEIMRCRLLCQDIGIKQITAKEERLVAEILPSTKLTPRVFSVLHDTNRQAQVTHDVYVWPHTGDPLKACQKMLGIMASCLKEVAEHRAAIGAK